MVTKKMLFIYNPQAGKAQIKNNLFKIIDIFTKAGYEVTAYPTQKCGDAIEAAREKAGEFEMLVCSGGDGTLDEVVTGMMQREERIPLGYIPAGSTNDFAKSLGIPANMIKAANTVVDGRLFPCDVGRFNDDTFVYIAAFGIFTDISYETDQQAKNVLGHLAYILEGAKRIGAIPSYHIRYTYDGQDFEDDFMFGMITNSLSVGGFRKITGKNVRLDDGVFEVILIKKPSNVLEMNLLLTSLLGRKINAELMHYFKTDKLEITARTAIPWTLDGEFGGNHSHVIIENINLALKIMVPRE